MFIMLHTTELSAKIFVMLKRKPTKISPFADNSVDAFSYIVKRTTYG